MSCYAFVVLVMPYCLPSAITHEIDIKKSRFIAHLAPVESREAALAVLQRLKADYLVIGTIQVLERHFPQRLEVQYLVAAAVQIPQRHIAQGFESDYLVIGAGKGFEFHPGKGFEAGKLIV